MMARLFIGGTFRDADKVEPVIEARGPPPRCDGWRSTPAAERPTRVERVVRQQRTDLFTSNSRILAPRSRCEGAADVARATEIARSVQQRRSDGVKASGDRRSEHRPARGQVRLSDPQIDLPGRPVKLEAMPIDPRTPVLIGYGQVNQHDDHPGVEPVDLMVAAARAAADPRVLEAVDSVRVVSVLSWRYRDPGLLLAQRLRAKNAATRYTGVGGNVPADAGQPGVPGHPGRPRRRSADRRRRNLAYPNAIACERRQARLDESRRVRSDGRECRRRCADGRARGDPDQTGPARLRLSDVRAGPSDRGRESADDHLHRIGELWSQFSGVAAKNPHAWSREPLAPHQIWQPRPRNRMISWPYTKLMNSQQHGRSGRGAGAHVGRQGDLSAKSRRSVGFFRTRARMRTTPMRIGERAEFYRSPAIRIAGQRALHLAGVGVDDLDLIDVYSCFPSAVQVAANELGLPTGDPSRPLTVTGGLTFAGGPWNNYVTHSIATMAERLLVANPGQRGLITANGGYLTKHSFGVYGTEPRLHEFRWEDVQSDVDREPTRTAAVEWSGAGGTCVVDLAGR